MQLYWLHESKAVAEVFRGRQVLLGDICRSPEEWKMQHSKATIHDSLYLLLLHNFLKFYPGLPSHVTKPSYDSPLKTYECTSVRTDDLYSAGVASSARTDICSHHLWDKILVFFLVREYSSDDPNRAFGCTARHAVRDEAFALAHLCS